MEEAQVNSKSSKNSTGIIVAIVVVVLLLIGGGAYYLSSGKNNQTIRQQPQATAANTPVPTTAAENVKTFTVKGTNYSFNPNKITVKKGDKVKIVFEDDDGFHDLVVDGYNVKTEQISRGNSSEVEFVADKTGSFQYYCGVGNHRERGMTGTLVVE